MLEIRRRLRRHRALIAAILLSGLAWGASGQVWPTGPATRWVVPGGEAGMSWDHLLFSPDGRSEVATQADAPKILDLATGRVSDVEIGPPPAPRTSRLPGHGPDEDNDPSQFRPRFGDPAFLEGGKFLVARDVGTEPSPTLRRPCLRVWDVATGKLRETFADLGDGSPWTDFRVSDDGSTLAYVHDPDLDPHVVTVWKPDGSIHHFPASSPIALSADGRYLAAVERGKTLYDVWEVATERLVAMCAVPDRSKPGPMALSADGRMMAECREGKMAIWDVATSTRIADLETREERDPWFSPDRSLLYLSRAPDALYGTQVWDLTQDPPREVFNGRTRSVSSDGHRVLAYQPLTTSNDAADLPQILEGPKDCRVVDLPSAMVRHRWADRTDTSRLSPDGRWLAKMDRRGPGRFRSLLSGLPAWLRRQLPYPSPSWRIEILDASSGRAVGAIDKEVRGIVRPEMVFVGGGSSLSVRTTDLVRIAPPPPAFSLRIETWDLPPRRPTWPALSALTAAAMVAGSWSDFRSARRRSAAA